MATKQQGKMENGKLRMRNERPLGVVCLLWVWLLIGCATPYQQPSAMPPAPLPGQSAVDANATLAAWNLHQSATADANHQATAVAQQATASAIHATEQAQSIATGTAQAELSARMATSDALAFQGTAQALVIEATRQTLAVNATATASAQQAAVVAALQADEATRLAQQREAERIRQERQRLLNTYLPPFFAAVLIIVTAVGGAIAYVQLTKNKPVTIYHDNRQVTILPDGNGGFRMLPMPQTAPRLTSTTTQPVALPQPALTGEIVTPDWALFEGWRDPYRALIGITVDGRPLAIDRNREPHLLAVGTTGTGKTTGIILPYTASMIGVGAHALLLNGRGADFKPFMEADHPNITVAPAVGREAMPLYLAQLLRSLVQEADRRSDVLLRYGVRSWFELPAHAGESGEILLVVDEFLAIIERMTELDRRAANGMWSDLIALTHEARKFGIFLLLTATDPTERALGRRGYTVRDQMARLAFSMKNGDASRKLLSPGSDWPQGSAGLEQGQFLANIVGQIHHGVSFHPDSSQIVRYLNGRDVPLNVLPDGVTAVVGATTINQPAPTEAWADGEWEASPAIDYGHSHSYDHSYSQAALDGQALDGEIAYMTSLNAVGRFLLGRDSRPSGQELEGRVKPALEWRIQVRECPHALRLLRRTG